jgi:hypothetical protein
MGKSRKRAVPYAKEHAAHARASVAGPLLLAAVRPVAERVRDNLSRRPKMDDDNFTVALVITGAEAAAILAAVDRAEKGVKP